MSRLLFSLCALQSFVVLKESTAKDQESAKQMVVGREFLARNAVSSGVDGDFTK